MNREKKNWQKLTKRERNFEKSRGKKWQRVDHRQKMERNAKKMAKNRFCEL